MKRLAPVFATMLVLLAVSVAAAGVVIEMEVKGPGSDSAGAIDTLYAEGARLRMDPHGSQGGENSSMIFRDDAMWIIDHDRKRCQTIDRQGMESLSSELGAAMKEMEAQLAQLPPEQRAMMEKMMQGRMPAGMGQDAPPRRVEKGGTEQVGDYTCTVHTLYSGDEKVWEVCAAAEGAVGGAEEAMEAFRAVSSFAESLRESIQQLPMARMIDTPFADMQQIGGVPVRVRTFSDGRLQSESTMKSVSSRDIDDAMFEVPKGYKVTDLADEIGSRRR